MVIIEIQTIISSKRVLYHTVVCFYFALLRTAYQLFVKLWVRIELLLYQIVVVSSHVLQVAVGSFFHDFSTFHDEDAVCVYDCGKTVGNH